MTCKKCSALRRKGKDSWLPCLQIRKWRMICAPWSAIFARTVFFFIETARQRWKRARASRRNRPELKAEADNDTVADGQSAARAVHHVLRGGRREYFVGLHWRFLAGPRAGRCPRVGCGAGRSFTQRRFLAAVLFRHIRSLAWMAFCQSVNGVGRPPLSIGNSAMDDPAPGLLDFWISRNDARDAKQPG